ncbi:hypothetical protein V499_04845 [Pseudogymnoascus sp. VKM F-103]|nr:hypothetical protein V499_04845 [Pseudogymnoascus sp. VKM F-103]
MNDTSKAGREMLYDAYNFAGTTDWAVDLQDYTADEGEGEEQEEDPTYGTDWEYQIRIHDKSSCTSKYRSLDQLENDADKIPADCFDKYLVDVEVAILKDSLNSYDSLINGGYDDKFSVYEKEKASTDSATSLQVYGRCAKDRLLRMYRDKAYAMLQ